MIKQTIHSIRDSQVEIIFIPMGSDITIAIYGGEKPHIGATLTSYLDANNCRQNQMATIPNHKEYVLVEKVLEHIQPHTDNVITIICGLHWQNISHDELEIVVQSVLTTINSMSKLFFGNN